MILDLYTKIVYNKIILKEGRETMDVAEKLIDGLISTAVSFTAWLMIHKYLQYEKRQKKKPFKPRKRTRKR